MDFNDVIQPVTVAAAGITTVVTVGTAATVGSIVLTLCLAAVRNVAMAHRLRVVVARVPADSWSPVDSDLFDAMQRPVGDDMCLTVMVPRGRVV